MDGYRNTATIAKEWGISERRLNILCKEGRIPGVEKFGGAWAIPSNAVKPKDERVKSGKYIKSRSKGE